MARSVGKVTNSISSHHRKAAENSASIETTGLLMALLCTV